MDYFMKWLKAAGIRTAIVSTKRGDTLEAIMARHGLQDQLEFIVGSEHVKRPKPDPQGLLYAVGALGVEKRELLFCGDTVLDAGAAENAGCPFAAVLNGTTGAEAFAEFAPLHISPDLPDLQAWLEV